MEPQIPLYISVIFIVLTFTLYAMIVTGYRQLLKRSGMDVALRKRKGRRLHIVFLFWLLFLARISDMHFFHNWSAMPPRLMIAFLPPLIFAIILTTSKKIV